MRVLSIQQPFAQLVVRGVKRLEVRTWSTDFRGRIAIHASAAVPSKEISAAFKTDRETALRFADQGWLDREDLKALPRSAIIGTVELIGVHTGEALHRGDTGLFAWNRSTERMELAEKDPRSGALRPVKTSKRPLPVPTPDDEYAWVFVDPVEIQPITDVSGLQNLWNLEGELEGVIADREKRSRGGWWRPPEVSASRRAKGIRAWRKQWESEREAFVRDVEERVARRRELKATRFVPEMEQQVQEDMTGYFTRHRVAGDGDGTDQVRVEARLLGLFGGREVVGVEEFELTVRRRLKEQTDARRARAKREEHRERLHALLDEHWKGGSRVASKDAQVRAKLEELLEKMLDEEDEDREFARRLAHPESEEQAVRGARRDAARAAEERALAKEVLQRAHLNAMKRDARTYDELAELELAEEFWSAVKEWDRRLDTDHG